MSKILIKNGRILDPETNRDERADVLIVDERIEKIGKLEGDSETKVIDATNLVMCPGMIDIHVHLRDLKQADKETVETGTLAARKGGVTTVFAMPNTVPPLSSKKSIDEYEKLLKNARVNVLIHGAITGDLKGKELADYSSYPKEVRMITDDGYDVRDEALLEQAYQKAKERDWIVMTHPEMPDIAPNGVINEGKISKKLGVPGQPNEKEWKAVERGIRLSKKTGARAHFTHVSTKESVELIREAKKHSDLITCDATPHHFSLTEDKVLEVGSLAKVNPPLRTEADRQAVIEGLKDGTIDLIATDHAPHADKDKTDDLLTSAFGISQLETAVASTITELHFNQGMPLIQVIRLLTVKPAKLTGLRQGRLQEGYPADLMLIDLNQEQVVDRMTFVSKGKNTPFEGMILKGWPIKTVIGGALY